MAKLRIAAPRLSAADNGRVKQSPKRGDPFYDLPEWRKLVARIIAKRGRICEDPACPAAHSNTMRVYADHIVELRDGGAPLDERNVQLLCASAHGRKTIAARAKRMAT